MFAVVLCARTTFFTLPSCAQLTSIVGPEHFVDVLGMDVKEVVPGTEGSAFNCSMWVTAKADCTTG
jgi:hypothetical protein